MTSKDEIDRVLAQAIAECLRHGGSDADVEALRQQFKAMMADEVEYTLASRLIPG